MSTVEVIETLSSRQVLVLNERCISSCLGIENDSWHQRIMFHPFLDLEARYSLPSSPLVPSVQSNYSPSSSTRGKDLKRHNQVHDALDDGSQAPN